MERESRTIQNKLQHIRCRNYAPSVVASPKQKKYTRSKEQKSCSGAMPVRFFDKNELKTIATASDFT